MKDVYFSNVSAEEQEQLGHIAERLRGEITARIIGQTKPPTRCCCGALSWGEAKAMEIRLPPAKGCAAYGSWRVTMSDGEGSYGLGITDFLSSQELAETFDRHFRPFVAEHLAAELARREARHAPGGDLHGSTFGIWF